METKEVPKLLGRLARIERGRIATIHMSWGNGGDKRLRVFVRGRDKELITDWCETMPIGNILVTGRVILMDAVVAHLGREVISQCVHSERTILFRLR